MGHSRRRCACRRAPSGRSFGCGLHEAGTHNISATKLEKAERRHTLTRVAAVALTIPVAFTVPVALALAIPLFVAFPPLTLAVPIAIRVAVSVAFSLTVLPVVHLFLHLHVHVHGRGGGGEEAGARVTEKGGRWAGAQGSLVVVTRELFDCYRGSSGHRRLAAAGFESTRLVLPNAAVPDGVDNIQLYVALVACP